jgi:hypothetical protein
MKRLDYIEEQVKQALSGEAQSFRACAFFDDRLDCIRVITKDCSVFEERLGDRITILLNMYDPQPGKRELVGFTLKGARHLCNQHGWSTAAPIQMSKLLDGIMASFPEKVVQVFIEWVAKPLVENQQIDQVEMPAGILEPA